MVEVTDINNILDGNTVLDPDYLHRIFLNAYIPHLRVGGLVVRLPTGYLGNPIPSPALFTRSVAVFAMS